MPKVRLFPDDSDNELDADRIKDLIGDCEYHLALSFMSKGDHEEAIKRFESLSNPWASYHTAQVYRKLALNEQNTTKQDDVSQDNHQSRYIALLTKAKEALYITLDRLKGNKSHQLNLVIYEEIDDIEFLLTRLAINNGPFPLIDDASSTESFCSANMNVSTGIPAFDSPPHDSHIRSSSPIQCRDSSLNDSERKKSPSNKKQTSKSHRNSSEGSHVRPSPERLDAQLRALQLSHISILKPIVDQNKELTKFNVSLQQQLRECKELNQLYLVCSKAALSVPDRHKSPSPQSPTSSTVADITITSGTTTITNTTAITTTTTTTTFPADSSTSNMPFSRLMNNTEYSGMLFSTLAAQANTQETTAFQKDKSKPFSWQGAGQKLFDVKSSPGAANNDEDDDDVVANVDIHFDPVIELPALIDRKSGEEDETPLFVQRSKLYRFDKSLNCWKEKGIGNMKILSHNGSVRFRLLFRREQVLKVACNHLLTTNLVLKRMSTSETSWCWVARDYTDDKEGTVEQFAVRFKGN
ncbi:E3 SUMO-protein ligase RanBP2-like [Octopus bimaculoides]|uniref:E3 SUMO-protein ligase RanBP2-like n=1 Tax=Octopus bimaculoides TaxID=37653 RepID=UPI0022E24A03|nr:E3 SUMO-protein ligase RanBP2-like [Octopus bimaculoides]